MSTPARSGKSSAWRPPSARTISPYRLGSSCARSATSSGAPSTSTEMWRPASSRSVTGKKRGSRLAALTALATISSPRDGLVGRKVPRHPRSEPSALCRETKTPAREGPLPGDRSGTMSLPRSDIRIHGPTGQGDQGIRRAGGVGRYVRPRLVECRPGAHTLAPISESTPIKSTAPTRYPTPKGPSYESTRVV